MIKSIPDIQSHGITFSFFATLDLSLFFLEDAQDKSKPRKRSFQQ